MDRLEELNQICKECLEKATKRFETIDARSCSYCAIGQEIHKLEVTENSQWNKVDWNASKYKNWYHG